MSATKIFVVDDDPIQLKRLSGVLGQHYAMTTQDRASGLLENVVAVAPDLIILDIELPDGNGIELCRMLKGQRETADIPVVFHSSHDTIDNRMEAYEVGGDDFFLKSMTADELVAKVGILLDWVVRNRQLERERESARLAARNAANDLGEVSIVLEAIRQAGIATDLTTLATIGVDALSDLQIEANVQVRAGKEKVTMNRRGLSTPLETSIIHNSRLSGKVFQFQNRLVVNFSHTSIFVNNLPTSNPTNMQRIRDMAAVIGEGLNSRARALDTEIALEERNLVLVSVTEQAEQALGRLDLAWGQRKQQAADALSRLKESMERDFLGLALSKREEDICMSTLQRCMAEVAAVFDQMPTADPILSKLKARLSFHSSQR
ncbi:MAG: response regulator [Burkholderiales bacterium]|nr:response regulator [Burkholderiales bacterium]